MTNGFSYTSPGRIQAAIERVEELLRPGECRCRAWPVDRGGPEVWLLAAAGEGEDPKDSWGWRAFCEECDALSPWSLQVREFFWSAVWSGEWWRGGVPRYEHSGVWCEVMDAHGERPIVLSDVDAARLDVARRRDALAAVPVMPDDWWPEDDVPGELFDERRAEWELVGGEPRVKPRRRRRQAKRKAE